MTPNRAVLSIVPYGNQSGSSRRINYIQHSGVMFLYGWEGGGTGRSRAMYEIYTAAAAAVKVVNAAGDKGRNQNKSGGN